MIGNMNSVASLGSKVPSTLSAIRTSILQPCFAALCDENQESRFHMGSELMDERIRQLSLPGTLDLLTRLFAKHGVAELTYLTPIEKDIELCQVEVANPNAF